MELNMLQVNGPIGIVPITPEQMKGIDAWLFVLMGPTGSGKSSFIESLVPDQHLNLSKDSLDSVTQHVNCYQVVNLGLKPDYYDKLFILMDTPGFLDPRLSEGRITRMITDSLNALRQYNPDLMVHILYFQPITDIRIGGSKRDAVKILREYVKQYNALGITIITTMWNTLGTPKQLEDAKHRFDTFKNEIYPSSGGLSIHIIRFDMSQASALSSLEGRYLAWVHRNVNSNKATDPQYQSLLCDNLLGRISNLLQQLQFIAEDKRHASRSGSRDPGLLEAILREEMVALTSLQSFLDDLASDSFGPSGVVALQSLLDARYEQDPTASSSRWPLSPVSPLVPSIPLPAGATLHPTGLDPLGIAPALIPSAHGQPPSPDVSCFAPIATAIRRQFNRTQR